MVDDAPSLASCGAAGSAEQQVERGVEMHLALGSGTDLPRDDDGSVMSLLLHSAFTVAAQLCR